ncbi:uncharacterized protein LOC111082047 isoform X2 [Drosophila obscura]|uniref:uncharacterized protein LOC111082047 isoform X2 n=1 Tax=Drosophila obscura TaxID=7282 RepID=UPI001BB2C425|nr:uncharacterized protein LOC111082047 isoform X2 [Drosophila obscura]
MLLHTTQDRLDTLKRAYGPESPDCSTGFRSARLLQDATFRRLPQTTAPVPPEILGLLSAEPIQTFARNRPQDTVIASMTDTRIIPSGASGLCMPSLPSHGLGSDEVYRPQLTDAPVSSSPISVFGPRLTCANGLSSRFTAERIAVHMPRRFLWRIRNRSRAPVLWPTSLGLFPPPGPPVFFSGSARIDAAFLLTAYAPTIFPQAKLTGRDERQLQLTVTADHSGSPESDNDADALSASHGPQPDRPTMSSFFF